MECHCHRCIREQDQHEMIGTVKIMLSGLRMVLCPDCGNKRCPRASDHRLACTRSNEPGQRGSIYQPLPAPPKEP